MTNLTHFSQHQYVFFCYYHEVSLKSHDIIKEDILLTEIYSNLPSPKVHPSTFLKDVDPRIRKHYLRVLTCDKPPGMVSTLYKYQARTVASMLEREVNPGVMPDPSYVPLRGVRGYQDFYLQPASMDILRGPLPSYTVPSGGILCEEMGTGKTCIILGLLVATKDRLSEPEEEFCGEFAKCALTELALRNFPFLPFKNARELTGQEISSQSFPSLKEILFHYIKTSPLTLSPSGQLYCFFFPSCGGSTKISLLRSLEVRSDTSTFPSIFAELCSILLYRSYEPWKVVPDNWPDEKGLETIFSNVSNPNSGASGHHHPVGVRDS